MEVADAKRLKALEAKNAKLKKMLAEQMMDVAGLKEMLGKNFGGLVRGGKPRTWPLRKSATHRGGTVRWRGSIRVCIGASRSDRRTPSGGPG